MNDPWQPLPRQPIGAARLARNIIFTLAGVVIGGPLLLRGCLWSLFAGAEAVNAWQNSGTATGRNAVVRASKYLGPRAAAFLNNATNARGEWRPPDFHGDDSQYYAFDLPVADIAAFERALVDEWSLGPNFAKLDAMPTANDEPPWMNVPPADGAFYERGFESVGINRTTGCVLLRHWAS